MYPGIDLGTSALKMLLINEDQSVRAETGLTLIVTDPIPSGLNRILKSGGEPSRIYRQLEMEFQESFAAGG